MSSCNKHYWAGMQMCPQCLEDNLDNAFHNSVKKVANGRLNMKPINEMTEQEKVEAVAVECMVLIIPPPEVTDYDSFVNELEVKNYNPLANTAEGIKQAIDLAVKYGLCIDFENKVVTYQDIDFLEFNETVHVIDFSEIGWQLAVVDSAILIARGLPNG